MTNPEYTTKEELRKNIEKGKSWTKKIEKAPTFKVTRCPDYSHIRDYHQDPGCYLLLSVDRKRQEIVVGVCNYQNQLLEEFRGKTAQQLYHYILNQRTYLSRLDHAAYLGKELKKAERALESGEEYLQE